MESVESFMRISYLKVAVALIGLVGFEACTPRIIQRGKVPEEEKLEKLRPGLSSKEDVIRLLGSPSSVSAFDSNVWLYVHRKTESVSFFTPKVLEKGVVKILFSPTGVIEEVHRLDAEGHDIAPVRRVTPSSTGSRPWTQQIFDNFGRQRNKKD